MEPCRFSFRRKLPHAEVYPPAVRRKFHRIAENIDQYLPQVQFISKDMRIFYILKFLCKHYIPPLQLSADDGGTMPEQFQNVKRFMADLHLPAFNAGHIQHIIDKAQQMP